MGYVWRKANPKKKKLRIQKISGYVGTGPKPIENSVYCCDNMGINNLPKEHD